MVKWFFAKRWSRIMAIFFATASAFGAGSTVVCDFDRCSEGPVSGQKGWKLYDKFRDSTAFLIATEVGTTETAGDNALIVTSAGKEIHGLACIDTLVLTTGP